jgi:hypothetical protein
LFYLVSVLRRFALVFTLLLPALSGCRSETARPAKAPHIRHSRKSASDAPAEKPSPKRQPCTFGADQTCNDDKSVSTLWGYCTSAGVCECNHGFEVSPTSQRCRPAR